MNAEKFETTPEMNAAMTALLRAVGDFALIANTQYAKVSPESAKAYAELWGAGAMVTDIRVQLTRGEHRIDAGYTAVADGKFHPVITLNVADPGVPPTAH
jgi:hypothetical protein